MPETGEPELERGDEGVGVRDGDDVNDEGGEFDDEYDWLFV